MSFLGKLFGKKEQESLDQGLEKTKQGFFERISKVIIGKTSVDEDVLDQLEEAIITHKNKLNNADKTATQSRRD